MTDDRKGSGNYNLRDIAREWDKNKNRYDPAPSTDAMSAVVDDVEDRKAAKEADGKPQPPKIAKWRQFRLIKKLAFPYQNAQIRCDCTEVSSCAACPAWALEVDPNVNLGRPHAVLEVHDTSSNACRATVFKSSSLKTPASAAPRSRSAT